MILHLWYEIYGVDSNSFPVWSQSGNHRGFLGVPPYELRKVLQASGVDRTNPNQDEHGSRDATRRAFSTLQHDRLPFR
ncbi:MAG: hypothetical protein ACREJU_12375 [Nitrospiraceae bacterium]